MPGMDGKRYKLWWFEKEDGVGGVGVLVKEELCEKVWKLSDRDMAVVLVIEEDVLRLMCGYSPQGGRSLEEKQSFYDELKCECDVHSVDDVVMCMFDINEYMGRNIGGLDSAHWGMM